MSRAGHWNFWARRPARRAERGRSLNDSYDKLDTLRCLWYRVSSRCLTRERTESYCCDPRDTKLPFSCAMALRLRRLRGLLALAERQCGAPGPLLSARGVSTRKDVDEEGSVGAGRSRCSCLLCAHASLAQAPAAPPRACAATASRPAFTAKWTWWRPKRHVLLTVPHTAPSHALSAGRRVSHHAGRAYAAHARARGAASAESAAGAGGGG